MPKQKRWVEKRHLDQATGEIDKAINFLVEVGYPFKGIHDDYYQAFFEIVHILQRIENSIDELRDLI